MGVSDGPLVGSRVGWLVDRIGARVVGANVGVREESSAAPVGDNVGHLDGLTVDGARVGVTVGVSEGTSDGQREGDCVGSRDGAKLGESVEGTEPPVGAVSAAKGASIAAAPSSSAAGSPVLISCDGAELGVLDGCRVGTMEGVTDGTKVG